MLQISSKIHKFQIPPHWTSVFFYFYFIFTAESQNTILYFQCRRRDGTFFPSIYDLIKKVYRMTPQLQQVMNTEWVEPVNTRSPPHAMLGEEEEDHVPVHNSEDR